MNTFNYFVYILKSLRNNSFYVGYTPNPSQRLAFHNQGRCKYSLEGVPWEIIESQKVSSRREAIRQVKHMRTLNQEELQKGLKLEKKVTE